VKHAHRLVGVDLDAARRTVEETVEFAMRELGDEEWISGMHPDIPETKVLDNPYTYTEWDAGSAQWKRR
jgi:5-methylthioadenosine/S-adenosylhomocysteine deaminase